MKKYILIGVPYCGKSTLGRRVAGLLQIPFFDTDAMAKSKVGEIRLFDMLNPHFNMLFHKEEINTVLELAEIDTSAVVATGAEVALITRCAKILQSMGVIIHIKREVKTIIDELESNVGSRLVLREVNNGTILDFGVKSVEEYSKSLPQYEAVANFTVDNNGSEDEGIEKLMALIQAIEYACPEQEE